MSSSLRLWSVLFLFWWQQHAVFCSGPAVFAHFMMGIVFSYTPEDWVNDIKAAQAMGIDAFALNCANEQQTRKQMPIAYEVAEQLGFKVRMINFILTEERKS
jgi:Glycosyl hydrolase family 71